MSFTLGSSHSGGDNEDAEADESTKNAEARSRGTSEIDGAGEDTDDEESQRPDALVEDGGRLMTAVEEGDEGANVELDVEDDYLQLERSRTMTPDGVDRDEGLATPVALSPLPSPNDSGSIPDDTPSIQGSRLSSPGREASRASSQAPGPRKVSAALQPFERRFEARPSPSRSSSSRTGSPAFLSPHSRQVSLSSQLSHMSSEAGSEAPEAPQAPWDVIRWTKLRKITGHAFSEIGKRNFGRPTCLAVSALIAVGTSKGLVLGFDYHQTLKVIIGQGTKATECGSVTALAIAADYSTIACGHANGHIFTWEINRPSQPFLRIPPQDVNTLQQPNHTDGHVANTAILHIGFLGTRHTALVSADAGGMAFSHLATRGLGPVTRTIKATRLLGRYPSPNPQAERRRKPSSVLAFSPLPLGNVEQPTDNMGITALLTPYLLVIVSTTPMAQTQYKSPRPKDITPHSSLSGCLAWFPAVKLKNPGTGVERGVSDAKLVYCWSNFLIVLEAKVIKNDVPEDANKPPSLEFHPRSRWRAEEAIVAVQWLGRSVLGVLTISQRLLIVEDGSLRVTDEIDLLHKYMYHQDLFSQQLQSVVEQLNPEDPSMHGVVADAFYMSFRAYKGRTFLLGFNDLTVGTLSNWADRLLALMEAGDHIAAIRLATDYYAGSANNVTVGLPDDDVARHRMVKERLLAMMSASLNYTFSQQDAARTTRLRELADVCLNACISMQETDFLFGDIFDMFEDAEEESIFITTLEPYILDGDVKTIPPEVVKTLVTDFISENQTARLEELLCRLDPHSLDLDQVTTLCRQHSLYDALIYVWTQGIGDFVTPLIDLLSLVKMLQEGDDDEELVDNPFYQSAKKTFPYLAYSLTSRQYPSGEPMHGDQAPLAKADLYEYLFAGKPTGWPQGSKRVFQTKAHADEEPAFPYLVLLLQFDTPNFISMLNEAFEDSFLNGPDDDSGINGVAQVNGTSSRIGYKMTRHHIVTILMDVMKQEVFSSDQVIYLDMFIARSLPKYPGQLVLTGSDLNNVLQHLCYPPSQVVREDCQLSVEYLLSAYHPPDVSSLITALRDAKFFRVLKSTYRSARMFPELLEVYFEDPDDKDTIFDWLAFCLRPSTGLNPKQVQDVKQTVAAHFDGFTDISTVLTARTLALHAQDLLQPCLDALSDSHQQFVFIRTLLEPALLPNDTKSRNISPLPQDQRFAFTERYVELMCQHDPQHVADYVGSLSTSDLRLDQVLPAMEDNGVVDAAVVLLARDGLVRDALDRLVVHLQSLQQALTGLISAAAQSPDVAATQEATQDIVEEIGKYTKVGLWLCQGQSTNAQRRPRPRTKQAWDVSEEDLDLDEYLWLNLIDAVVQVTKNVTSSLRSFEDHPSGTDMPAVDVVQISSALRNNVQQTFTSLLAVTATPSIEESGDKQSQTRNQNSLSFLRVLRTFLTRTASTAPSLSDLRAVLSDLFLAYNFEEGVLSLANELLGSDVFTDINEAHELRQRGWRPRSQVCEQCKRRAWGPSIGEIAWDEWLAREQDREAEKARKIVSRGGGEEARRLERGKGKAKDASPTGKDTPQSEETRRLALVVFACRHVFHRVCLDEAYRDGKTAAPEKYKCPLCIEKT